MEFQSQTGFQAYITVRLLSCLIRVSVYSQISSNCRGGIRLHAFFALIPVTCPAQMAFVRCQRSACHHEPTDHSHGHTTSADNATPNRDTHKREKGRTLPTGMECYAGFREGGEREENQINVCRRLNCVRPCWMDGCLCIPCQLTGTESSSGRRASSACCCPARRSHLPEGPYGYSPMWAVSCPCMHGHAGLSHLAHPPTAPHCSVLGSRTRPQGIHGAQ